MTNTVLDIKEWYSIDNVCNRIKGSVSDIHDFLVGKQLTVYGRLKGEELLAFKKLSNNGRYVGKAKVHYSGLVKLNKFKLDTFNKYRTIEASSISILSLNGLYNEIVTDDFPSWIYESHISKWKYIEMDETFLDFEYCAFPTKNKSGASHFGDVIDFFDKYSNDFESNNSSPLLIEYRRKVPQYSVNTSLKFNEIDIVFVRQEVEALLKNESQKKMLITKFHWYSSFKRKDKLKKIVELLVTKNASASARELWELLKQDSDTGGTYDPDCIIEEIVGDYLHLKDEREVKFKTFCNSTYSCRAFLSN